LSGFKRQAANDFSDGGHRRFVLAGPTLRGKTDVKIRRRAFSPELLVTARKLPRPVRVPGLIGGFKNPPGLSGGSPIARTGAQQRKKFGSRYLLSGWPTDNDRLDFSDAPQNHWMPPAVFDATNSLPRVTT